MGEKIAWDLELYQSIERMNAATCSLCKGAHMTRKCPDLHDPLKPGFHSGGNGGQGHSHDEEDRLYRDEALGSWCNRYRKFAFTDLRVGRSCSDISVKGTVWGARG